MEWKPRGGISETISDPAHHTGLILYKNFVHQTLPRSSLAHLFFSIFPDSLHQHDLNKNSLETNYTWVDILLPWVLQQLQVMQSQVGPWFLIHWESPSINVRTTCSCSMNRCNKFPHAMFHMFLISGNSNGIHSNLDMFSLGFFVVSAVEDFNKIWIWLTHFCYWIKWDVCGECWDVTFSILSMQSSWQRVLSWGMQRLVCP